MRRRPLLSWDTWLGPTVLTFECQSATIWHFGTQLRLALGTLALSSVWHLALWHSAPVGTWHFGTQLRFALGTSALQHRLALRTLALNTAGACHVGTLSARAWVQARHPVR